MSLALDAELRLVSRGTTAPGCVVASRWRVALSIPPEADADNLTISPDNVTVRVGRVVIAVTGIQVKVKDTVAFLAKGSIDMRKLRSTLGMDGTETITGAVIVYEGEVSPGVSVLATSPPIALFPNSERAARWASAARASAAESASASASASALGSSGAAGAGSRAGALAGAAGAAASAPASAAVHRVLVGVDARTDPDAVTWYLWIGDLGVMDMASVVRAFAQTVGRPGGRVVLDRSACYSREFGEWVALESFASMLGELSGTKVSLSFEHRGHGTGRPVTETPTLMDAQPSGSESKRMAWDPAPWSSSELLSLADESMSLAPSDQDLLSGLLPLVSLDPPSPTLSVSLLNPSSLLMDRDGHIVGWPAMGGPLHLSASVAGLPSPTAAEVSYALHVGTFTQPVSESTISASISFRDHNVSDVIVLVSEALVAEQTALHRDYASRAFVPSLIASIPVSLSVSYMGSEGHTQRAASRATSLLVFEADPSPAPAPGSKRSHQSSSSSSSGDDFHPSRSRQRHLGSMSLTESMGAGSSTLGLTTDLLTSGTTGSGELSSPESFLSVTLPRMLIGAEVPLEDARSLARVLARARVAHGVPLDTIVDTVVFALRIQQRDLAWSIASCAVAKTGWRFLHSVGSVTGVNLIEHLAHADVKLLSSLLAACVVSSAAAKGGPDDGPLLTQAMVLALSAHAIVPVASLAVAGHATHIPVAVDVLVRAAPTAPLKVMVWAMAGPARLSLQKADWLVERITEVLATGPLLSSSSTGAAVVGARAGGTGTDSDMSWNVDDDDDDDDDDDNDSSSSSSYDNGNAIVLDTFDRVGSHKHPLGAGVLRVGVAAGGRQAEPRRESELETGFTKEQQEAATTSGSSGLFWLLVLACLFLLAAMFLSGIMVGGSLQQAVMSTAARSAESGQGSGGSGTSSGSPVWETIPVGAATGSLGTTAPANGLVGGFGIARVRARGTVLCGLADPSSADEPKALQGDLDIGGYVFCSAVAAAVLGDRTAVQPVPISGGSEVGDVVVARGSYMAGTSGAATASLPLLLDGLTVAGRTGGPATTALGIVRNATRVCVTPELQPRLAAFAPGAAIEVESSVANGVSQMTEFDPMSVDADDCDAVIGSFVELAQAFAKHELDEELPVDIQVGWPPLSVDDAYAAYNMYPEDVQWSLVLEAARGSLVQAAGLGVRVGPLSVCTQASSHDDEIDSDCLVPGSATPTGSIDSVPDVFSLMGLHTLTGQSQAVVSAVGSLTQVWDAVYGNRTWGLFASQSGASNAVWGRGGAIGTLAAPPINVSTLADSAFLLAEGQTAITAASAAIVSDSQNTLEKRNTGFGSALGVCLMLLLVVFAATLWLRKRRA